MRFFPNSWHWFYVVVEWVCSLNLFCEALMDNKVYHSAHLAYLCRYHVVFCPKYRRKILTSPLMILSKRRFLKLQMLINSRFLKWKLCPITCICWSNAIPASASCPALHAWKQNPLRKWSHSNLTLSTRLPTIWTRGAFIATVGSVSLETVKKYIESQKNV